MTSSKISLHRFKGCLIGSLIGDCFGAMYEGCDQVPPVSRICDRMKTILDGKPSDDDKLLEFTDDSAMAFGLCESLLETEKVDVTHLAKTFTKNYFKEPDRGYGAAAPALYHELSANKFTDVVGPAASIHQGSGSFGNGGAMRIAPMSLFAAETVRSDAKHLIALTEAATRVTHTNPRGIAGATLQSLAVRAALTSSNPPDHKEFLASLRSSLASVDGAADYLLQIDAIDGELTKGDSRVDEQWVEETLGVSIVAHRSVSTALYAFLRSLRPVDGIDFDNPFVRCILLAVSFGGDTDTIACMAGAIAGALHGVESIPANLMSVCEGAGTMLENAAKLHDLVYRHGVS